MLFSSMDHIIYVQLVAYPRIATDTFVEYIQHMCR